MKAPVYPEYVALLHAAKALGRPVRWTDQRSESFVSDHHGRGHALEAALALDKDGRFLAVRVSGYGDLGAYLSQVDAAAVLGQRRKNLPGVYATPAIDVSIQCVFTNTTPIGAYRGAGRPEGNYIMERLVEAAAAETGIDRVELRRRNHIPAGRDALPGGVRQHLRFGRVHAAPRARRRGRRLGRLRGPARREPRPRPAPRHRHRPVSRGHGAADERDGRHPLRDRRDGHDHHRHARLRARATRRRSRRCCRSGSASRSSASGCCRAIPTSSSPAAAPAARSRSWRAAPRS